MSFHNTFIAKLRQAGLQPFLSRTAAMASEKLANVNELVDNNSNNNLLPRHFMRDAPGLFAHNHTSQVIFSASEQSSIGFIPHNVAFYENPQGILGGQDSGVPQAADDDSAATEAFSDEGEEEGLSNGTISFNTAFYEIPHGIVMGQNAEVSADDDTNATEEFPSTDGGSVATEAFPEEEDVELPSISSVPLDASFFEIPQGFIIGRGPGECQLQRACKSNGVPFNGPIIGVPIRNGTYSAVPKPGGGVELVPSWETASNATEEFSDVDMEKAPIHASPANIEISQEPDAFLETLNNTLSEPAPGTGGEASQSADQGLSPAKNKRKRNSEQGNDSSIPNTKRRKATQEEVTINVPLGKAQILGVETPELATPAPKLACSGSSSLNTVRSLTPLTPEQFRPKTPETVTVRIPTPEPYRPKSPEAVLHAAGVVTHDWAYPGPYPNGGKPPANPPPKAQENTDITKASPPASQGAAADSFPRRLASDLASRPQEAEMTAESASNDGSAPRPRSPSARMAEEDSATAAQEKGTMYSGPSLAPQLATLETAYLLQSAWYHKTRKMAAWAKANAIAPGGTPNLKCKRKATADEEDSSTPAPKEQRATNVSSVDAPATAPRRSLRNLARANSKKA